MNLVGATRPNGGDTQSRNLRKRKKLAQVSCASFLHQIFVQVHASSAGMGTQNFYMTNLNKFKK